MTIRASSLALCLAVAIACAESPREEHARRVDAVQLALLQGDASRALDLSRTGLREVGPDGALLLGAASALLMLERHTEAVRHAEQGLATEPDDADVVADLNWALGKARLGLYRELRATSDWRAANGALERATLAGTKRAEAAYALVLMQGMLETGTDARMLKFGRLLLELEPQGERAEAVRSLLAAAGLEP